MAQKSDPRLMARLCIFRVCVLPTTKKYLPILGKLLVLFICALACWLLYDKLKRYSMEEIIDSILHIRHRQLVLAVGLVVLNYAILVGYDWLAVRAIHRRLPFPRVCLVSFAGSAVSYNLGALLGGTTVRYRLYSAWGFHPIDIVRLVLMLAVTFWIGALGLAGGDELLSVDGNELNDTLDYDFYTDSKSFHLKAKVADGIREWDVRREERGPFGCDFSTYLGDQKHSCSNHCMFCFIDQLPPGMRESLYFKDDDERLSFLFGNYITMTNMQDHEIDRIIKMHISPINISVHTTNPQLRVRMLANKRGGEVLKYLPRLVEGGIAVNCQLVLCRGINDGDELRRTLTDLLELTPMVQSVAAVPCGVTDYRQNLFKQTPYDAETSAAVIDIMEEFGDECKRRHGKRIIYPSDEWYLKAGRPIPEPEFYEDYDQLENGVGMMSLFREEFLAELEKPHRIYGTKKMDVVTGTMAAPLITEMMDELHRQYPMIEVNVHPIKNNFFGGNVGVAGLVTATDIIAQCEGRLSSGTLGVPAVMLREEKDTFLDDMTIEQLGQRLGVKVEVLPTGGGDEAKALLRSGLHIARRRRP